MAAAQTLRRKFFFRRSSRTVSPPAPSAYQSQTNTSNEYTFKDNEDQPHIAEVHKCLLPVQRQDVPDGHAVDEADDDLANEPGLDNFGGDPFCDAEEEEEGYDGQEGDDYAVLVGVTDEFIRLHAELYGGPGVLFSKYVPVGS